MRKAVLNTRGFKMNRTFAILAVFTIIALLLMVEVVAETVVKAGNSLGVNMPATPIFRQVAGNMFLIGAGSLLLLLSMLVVVPLIKFAVIGAGLALAGYGIYQLYKFISGGSIQDILPKK